MAERSDNDLPIPAATVMLLRDCPAFEVLMIERHSAIGFAGGALVFPGGRVGKSDAGDRWSEYASLSHRGLESARIAAIREAFEETGILLARRRSNGQLIDGDRVARLAHWRKRIENEPEALLALCEEEGLILACDLLTHFAHWTAPPGLHKRFDTHFFVAATPSDQVPLEDGDEATEALWVRPVDAIAAGHSGARKIIFPTARNLELLALYSSAASAISACAQRRIERIQPAIEMRDGVAHLTIPDGLGYPVTEEPLESALRS